MIAGFIAYYSVVHDAPSHEAMTIHRNWAIATFMVILVVAFWSVWQRYRNKKASILFLVGMIIAFVLVSITAWYGAELVYRYGLGVKSPPKPSIQDQNDSHNDKHLH